jgi:putative membrane protein
MQISLPIVAAIAITACGDSTVRTDTPDATGTSGTASATAGLDRGWINDQLEDGDREVRLGRLAEEKGASEDVRAYGRMMVEHHTMAGTELKQIATRNNVTPETDDQGENQRDFDRLSALSGNAFDRAYLDAMVDDHEDAVDEIEDKVNDNDEHADIKGWAGKTLPVVKQHLEKAKELRGRLPNNM